MLGLDLDFGAAGAGTGAAYLVTRCLRRSGARLLKVAHGIAVCPDPDLLEQILPADATQVTHAVRALTAAGLLAGGEFPIPVVQGTANNAAVSVQFKEFGIRLNFTPTVVENRVRLKVRPEVSTLDFGNAVVL